MVWIMCVAAGFNRQYSMFTRCVNMHKHTRMRSPPRSVHLGGAQEEEEEEEEEEGLLTSNE